MRHLLHAINSALDRAESPGGAAGTEFAHLRRSLRSGVARPDFEPPSTHDYGSLLASIAAANTLLGAVVTLLKGATRELRWGYHYAPRPGEDDLGRSIAFAEILGPDGPFAATAGRVGFTLMAPHTLYPLHTHPAVELYWVVSGTAEWSTPGSTRNVPPGEFVLHRTQEPHAMRTTNEPLLALWNWSGDIDAPAVYV